MGNNQSRSLDFEAVFISLKVFLAKALHSSNFITSAFVGCLRELRKHVDDKGYGLTPIWKGFLAQSAKKAFAFYKELYALDRLLSTRDKLVMSNLLFLEVNAKCREHLEFHTSTKKIYYWSRENLEIFFKELEKLVSMKLEELCIYESTVDANYPLDLVNFDAQFKPYLDAYIRRITYDDPRSGDGSFLEHPGVFDLFLAMLENTVNVVSLYLAADKIFSSPVWIAKTINIEWIGILTSCCFTIQSPGGHSREFITGWAKNTKPRRRLELW